MDNSTHKMTKEEIKREIIEWIIVIEVAVVFAVIINMFLIVNAVIPTASMQNTIMVGDRIFGNRLAYIHDEPQRGDIVIFKFPDNEKELYIKRVIGLPGDTVEVTDGKVYINGSSEPLTEPYLAEEPFGSFGTFTVPEDCFFMMGDNRNNSYDSRYWNHTFVARDKILGRAMFRYYRKIGKIEQYHNY